MHPKSADRKANSVDPDQTGAVWSGSTLFAETGLSENLGTLRYIMNATTKMNKKFLHTVVMNKLCRVTDTSLYIYQLFFA